MKRSPLVSAIIPTYNRAAVVCAAIDSVLNQTYTSLEIIVVDDGSTDDTQAKLRQYQGKIRIVTQSNAGATAAYNHGIRISRGEIIAFLDSDDLWKPTKLERQVAALQKAGRSVPCCLCNTTLKLGSGQETSAFELSSLIPRYEEGIWLNVAEVLVTRFVLFQQPVAIRREVLERIGNFDERLWFLEDYELALRLSLEGPWAFIREPLAVWHEGTVDSLSQKAQKDEIQLIECAMGIRKGLLPRIKDGHEHAVLRKNLERELKRGRRRLRIAKLDQGSSLRASTLGTLLRKVEQFRGFVFRRSPWFPRMKTVPFDGGGV